MRTARERFSVACVRSLMMTTARNYYALVSCESFALEITDANFFSPLNDELRLVQLLYYFVQLCARNAHIHIYVSEQIKILW